MRHSKLAIAVLIACVMVSPQSLALLWWGQPRYIVVGPNAPEREVFAAKEFQRLYKQRTGTELPIQNREGGANGVYIGRSALDIEREPQFRLLPDGTKQVCGTPERWESYLEKQLEIDFDMVPSNAMVSYTCGWTNTFALFIAGANPEATVESVYNFCDQHLDMQRVNDEQIVISDKPFIGWSYIRDLTNCVKCTVPANAAVETGMSENPINKIQCRIGVENQAN